MLNDSIEFFNSLLADPTPFDQENAANLTLLKLSDSGTNRQCSPEGRTIVAGGFSRRSAGSWTFRPEGGRTNRPSALRAGKT